MATAIKVENLSKIYRLGEIGTGTISRDIERFVKTRILKHEDPFLKIGETNDRATKGASDIVYSLKDINFEIEQGDAVGIIGRNGAGKSTLLKILSRVTSPTTGKINIKGRVASLLEVGTGFHPELTGRENIYLNGAILGMRRREIDRNLDEIIDFSGVERYIDTPVKRYSSGMYVRLAFAVAAHLESEILIVDEVLAVGDAEFQKKCLGKMGEVSKNEGRTVLFVSHNMGAISELCQNCILINNGIKFSHGDSQKVILNYKNLGKEKKPNKIIFEGELGKNIELTSFFLNGKDIFKNEILVNPDENLEFEFLTKFNLPNIKIRVSIVIFYNDIRICTISDHRGFHEFNAEDFFSFKIKRNILRPGLFTVGIGIRTIENRWAWQKNVSNFEILDISIDEFYKYDIGLINLKNENT
jgi:lipopolysaccharide transport system ATP-binding protein